MLFSLIWTALVMGLVGGPHCLVMCAAPCSIVIGEKPAIEEQVVVVHARDHSQRWRFVIFHLGRVAGYALLGGIAAVAMESLAWLTSQTTALQKLWALMHVAVMAWGLALLVQASQPAWLERAGRAMWSRVQPWVRAPGGSLAAGVAWALMPCGLLYSAVLVAALSGGAWQGALSMAAFAVGSAVWLVSGPWLWRTGRLKVNALRAQWGTRIAGVMLMGVASWALWMDLVYKPSLWCR